MGAKALPEIQVGTNVVVQDTRSGLWDAYGVVTAISPQRQYHIKTQQGSVLVRNRHFLHRRVPESVPYLQFNNQLVTGSETEPEYITCTGAM